MVDILLPGMLRIRFSRVGKKNSPSFRLVVTPQGSAPKGKFLEILGFYDPKTKEKNIKKERVLHWIAQGAQPSDSAHNFLITEGIIEAKKKAVHSKAKKKKEEKPEKEKTKEAPVEEKQPEEAEEIKDTEVKEEKQKEEKKPEKEETKNTGAKEEIEVLIEEKEKEEKPEKDSKE